MFNWFNCYLSGRHGYGVEVRARRDLPALSALRTPIARLVARRQSAEGDPAVERDVDAPAVTAAAPHRRPAACCPSAAPHLTSDRRFLK